MANIFDIENLMCQVEGELHSARSNYPAFNTAHEGYAILLEEIDELWDLIKVKQSKHDKTAMRAEAIQIAAMALRFVLDVTDKK